MGYLLVLLYFTPSELLLSPSKLTYSNMVVFPPWLRSIDWDLFLKYSFCNLSSILEVSTSLGRNLWFVGFRYEFSTTCRSGGFCIETETFTLLWTNTVPLATQSQYLCQRGLRRDDSDRRPKSTWVTSMDSGLSYSNTGKKKSVDRWQSFSYTLVVLESIHKH